MICRSRHPKINYWFWFEETLQEKSYVKTLERLAATSRFDTITLSDRGCDFWDTAHKEDFRKLVTRAHELGLKIVIQLWPKGGLNHTATSFVTEEDGAAIALDVEGEIKNGRATIRSQSKGTRYPDAAPSVYSEFIYAAVFRKTADGFYESGTFHNVTDRLKTIYRSPDRVSATIDAPEYEGYHLFAIAAHYHRVADSFHPRACEDFKEFMDTYADIPFDGVALDEYRSLVTISPWDDVTFRGRIYGRAFADVFREKTGKNLTDVLFDMRYCPEGKSEARRGAINLYFDVMRHGTTIVDNFVCDYAKKTYGENAFLGFHSTYHNTLKADEVWNTGCNWWDVKRDYAQTDESIAFPVRMGLACIAKENIVYDMFYSKHKEAFFEKCIKDAPYGSRIHYHAIDDAHWGTDTGSAAFLEEVSKYEECVELLNLFEPALPLMPLLTVFGFPAQFNWYPDESNRSSFDVNKSLQVLDSADTLWQEGYLNALTPDDAIERGLLSVREDGKFVYGRSVFDAMLFLYPEYAKPSTVAFLRDAIAKGARFKVIGRLTHGFDGKALDGTFLAPYKVANELTAAKELSLPQNDIENGCRLADGSVVISHYRSIRNDVPHTAVFLLDGSEFCVVFKGTFATKTDGKGNIEKLACASLSSLTKDGEEILPHLRGSTVTYGI